MPKRQQKPTAESQPIELRIIGGKYRGSKLIYHGDPVTRPMKERVRESIFNLISTEAEGKHAIDLFAGTGALGLEALSRGAASTTFIEKHVPTSRVVEANIAALGVGERCELLTTSAFLWGKRDLPNTDWESRIAELRDQTQSDVPVPWLVFCSPPYAFFVERTEEMLGLIGSVLHRAPAGSIVIVEADERFDFAQLPGGVQEGRHGDGWDVRPYPPAVVAVRRLPG